MARYNLLLCKWQQFYMTGCFFSQLDDANFETVEEKLQVTSDISGSFHGR